MIGHFVTADDPDPLVSEHFILHYRLRNPRKGSGHHANGVRDEGLLHTYLDGLTKLHALMVAAPWSRAPLAEPVRVFVAELTIGGGDPFTTWDDKGTYIALPCRTSEPTSAAEEQLAAAMAVHEATHVFNCRERPLSQRDRDAWDWYDEAMAIFMESVVLPGNKDHLRFMGDWVEKPHLSLDAPNARYQAGHFIAYLAKRFGSAFVNEVWVKSVGMQEIETPLQALRDFAPHGQPFLSTDPDTRDIFASGYCLDSWFLNDPQSQAYNPDLYDRFGQRAVMESFDLKVGDQVKSEKASLNHLACHYFRFNLASDVTCLELTLCCEGEQAQLKAELACADIAGRCIRREVLRTTIAPTSETQTLTLQIGNLQPQLLDHIVLVVANCGTRSAATNRPVRASGKHDDGKMYDITVMAT